MELPSNFSEFNFKAMMKGERNPHNCMRLLAMLHIQEGKTLQATADILKVHMKTVQKWLAQFRAGGIDALFVQPKPGAPRKLNAKIEDWISDLLHSLNSETSGGQITGKQIHALVEKQFSISCSLRTIYNALHRLNFSWITSRSIHPKANLEVQEVYKKISSTAQEITS
jgi:transposase